MRRQGTLQIDRSLSDNRSPDYSECVKLTYYNMPSRGTLLLIFYPLLDIASHVLEILELAVMLHFYKLHSVSQLDRFKISCGGNPS